MKNPASQPEFSVVVPVYNEVKNLNALVQRCLDACRPLGMPFEIILVDDGSKDGSREMLAAFAGQELEIKGVLLNRNYGQHAAIRAGLAQTRGRYILTLDADLQNPPEELPRVLQELQKGFDVVGTVRINRQDSFFRRSSSRLVNLAVKKLTGVDMHDYGCMLRGYSRPIVDAMLQCKEQSTFIPILANRFAGSTTEISVKHDSRNHGDSKYSFWKLVNLQFDLLTSMSTFPLRLVSLVGVLLAGLGIGLGLLLTALRLMRGPEWAADGVLTVTGILSVLIGLQFIAMGMLGEYLGRVYDDVRARPRYLVESLILHPTTGESI